MLVQPQTRTLQGTSQSKLSTFIAEGAFLCELGQITFCVLDDATSIERQTMLPDPQASRTS